LENHSSTDNILSIHNQILKEFRLYEEMLPELQARLRGLEELVADAASRPYHSPPQHRPVMTSSMRLDNRVKDDMDKLRHQISSITSKENIHFYMLCVAPILQAYRLELEKPIEFSFMGGVTPVDSSRMDDIQQQFYTLVDKLRNDLDFIKNLPTYNGTVNALFFQPHSTRFGSSPKDNNAPVGWSDQFVSRSGSSAYSSSTSALDQTRSGGDEDACACEWCDADDWIINNNTMVCGQCGAENNMNQLTFSYKDIDRINITTKYTYDRRVHFRDCINQFQGKQNSTILPEVYDKLIEYFRKHNLVNEDEGVPEAARYEKITKRHVLIFLKEIECTKHYEDVNLIYHNITGKKLDDISHLEDALMKDFDILSDLYNERYIKTKKIDRKNFINTHYVLYQLLRRHKYPCSKYDFNLLKTVERKSFHDDICSELFRELSWNFDPCF